MTSTSGSSISAASEPTTHPTDNNSISAAGEPTHPTGGSSNSISAASEPMTHPISGSNSNSSIIAESEPTSHPTGGSNSISATSEPTSHPTGGSSSNNISAAGEPTTHSISGSSNNNCIIAASEPTTHLTGSSSNNSISATSEPTHPTGGSSSNGISAASEPTNHPGGRSNSVSAVNQLTTRSTSAALRDEGNPDTDELQWFDRYSQWMSTLACTFLGAGASALTIKGFNDQPVMRVPLMVTTISAWFALFFLSLLHVYSLRKMRMFLTAFLALSGLAFLAAFLAAPWTLKECGSRCRTAGVVAERVLVTIVVAAGLGSICFMQTSTGSSSNRVELQRVDRCSQWMFKLACTFLGVGVSALTINGFNDQPAMRVPLVVTTISAWFTLFLLFLSHVYSHHKHEWARMKRILMFPAGFLALSSLAFLVAFLAAPWCDSGCCTVGVEAERVLVTAVVAAGLGSIYFMQTSTGSSSNSSAASRPTTHSTGAVPRHEGHPDSVDRNWQLMFALTCAFLCVGTSAFAINEFNEQPAMRVPLIVTTISAWLTLPLLFLSLPQVYFLQKHEQTRMRRILVFPAGFLVLSGLTFVVTFLAALWTSKKCDLDCLAIGVVVGRVVVTPVVAAGLGSIYFMQRSVTRNVGEA